MSNLVHNERIKLTANLFNNLAVISVATGFIAPIFSIRPSATPIGFSDSGTPVFAALSLYNLGGIFAGIVLCGAFEVAAHIFLMKLKE